MSVLGIESAFKKGERISSICCSGARASHKRQLRLIAALVTARIVEQAHLDDVNGCEVPAEPVQAPIGEGQLQQAEEAIDGVVNGDHAPKVGVPKQRPENRVVGGVQEEPPRAPYDQRHNLQRQREGSVVTDSQHQQKNQMPAKDCEVPMDAGTGLGTDMFQHLSQHYLCAPAPCLHGTARLVAALEVRQVSGVCGRQSERGSIWGQMLCRACPAD